MDRPGVVLGHPYSSQRDEQLVGPYRTATALCLAGSEDRLRVMRETDLLSAYNSRAWYTIPVSLVYEDSIQSTSLWGNVRCGKVQTLEEVVGLVPIYQLSDDKPVPRLVKLIDKHPVELSKFLDDSNDDIQEGFKIGCISELLVNL